MAILGVIFNFFYVAFFVMCGTIGYLFHVWGGVGVGLDLVALKRAWQVKDPP